MPARGLTFDRLAAIPYAGLPIGVAVTSEPPASGIDTEEDLERANARWDAFMTGAMTNAG